MKKTLSIKILCSKNKGFFFINSYTNAAVLFGVDRKRKE